MKEEGGGERGKGGGTRRKATNQPVFLDFSDSSSDGSAEEIDKVQRVSEEEPGVSEVRLLQFKTLLFR